MSKHRRSKTERESPRWTLRPLRNEHDYEAALARIRELWDAPEGSSESDEMQALSILVDAYEQAAHPVPLPHPIDALLFAMDQRGLKRKDLEPILGGSGRVSEILQLKRPLTLSMIRRLHQEVGLNPTIAIREYALKGVARTKKRSSPKPGAQSSRAGRATGGKTRPPSRGAS